MIGHSNGCAAWHREQLGIKTPEQKRIEELEAENRIERNLRIGVELTFDSLNEEIGRLKAEVAQWRDDAHTFHSVIGKREEQIVKLQAQLAECKRDAERYRFIRYECMWEPRYVVVHVSTPAPAWETVRTPMELDESIDHFIALKDKKDEQHEPY